MRTRILIVLWVAIFQSDLVAGAAEPRDSLNEGMVNPGYHEPPAWFKQSFLDIRDDIREAGEQGKRVVLYFYQDGCPYCKKLLDINLSQQDIVEKIRSDFDVIAINMWGDREVTDSNGQSTTEKRFARDLKVNFTPTLLFLDETGNVIMRLNGYYPPHKFATVVDYVGQHLEKEISFRAYWARVSPPAATGKLHKDPGYLQPPYRLAERSGGKPLLVLFEQKDCRPCDELHLDILRRSESAELLDRFDVVLLDMWSNAPVQTPSGADSTASDWSRQLNIQYAPSMVLFDVSGQEILRREAYLKAFHTQGAMHYVLSGAYKTEPSFQRYLQARMAELEEQGIHVDLME